MTHVNPVWLNSCRGKRPKIYEGGGKFYQILLSRKAARILKGNTARVRKLLEDFSTKIIGDMPMSEFLEKYDRDEL